MPSAMPAVNERDTPKTSGPEESDPNDEGRVDASDEPVEELHGRIDGRYVRTFGRPSEKSDTELKTQAGESNLEALRSSALPTTTELSSPSVIRIPPPVRSPYRFEVLRELEGTVIKVGEDEFEARLTDLTDPTWPEESAVFSKKEISPGDLPLLAKGAVFRWSIGYKTWKSGRRERVGVVTFHRLPAWSEQSIRKVEETAEELKSVFPDSEST